MQKQHIVVALFTLAQIPAFLDARFHRGVKFENTLLGNGQVSRFPDESSGSMSKGFWDNLKFNLRWYGILQSIILRWRNQISFWATSSRFLCHSFNLVQQQRLQGSRGKSPVLLIDLVPQHCKVFSWNSMWLWWVNWEAPSALPSCSNQGMTTEERLDLSFVENMDHHPPGWSLHRAVVFWWEHSGHTRGSWCWCTHSRVQLSQNIVIVLKRSTLQSQIWMDNLQIWFAWLAQSILHIKSQRTFWAMRKAESTTPQASPGQASCCFSEYPSNAASKKSGWRYLPATVWPLQGHTWKKKTLFYSSTYFWDHHRQPPKKEKTNQQATAENWSKSKPPNLSSYHWLSNLWYYQ